MRAIPIAAPGPGEVRVRIVACGLNFAELMARQGLYATAPAPPCVLGYEAAGEVEVVGEGDVPFRVGDRVLVIHNFGCHSAALTVPASHCIRIPDALSFVEAAALPVNYLTAYLMLFRIGNLRPGQRVRDEEPARKPAPRQTRAGGLVGGGGV